MSNIIRVGSELRTITNNFTDQERNVLGRELAEKIGELSSIDSRIKAVYEQREVDVLALEEQRKTLNADIERLQKAVSAGRIDEQIQCDVYQEGQNKIVVKTGCLPTDAAAIIETIALSKNEDPSVADPLPVPEIQPEDEAPDAEEIENI
jgi:hypothetical protein